jgi:hypothetical protein
MDPTSRIRQNPFFVLGLSPEAPRAQIERTAQRLQAELALGRTAAKTYATPFGLALRTEDMVRASVAELRDPVRRLGHELWARVPVRDDSVAESPALDWALGASVLGVRTPA